MANNFVKPLSNRITETEVKKSTDREVKGKNPEFEQTIMFLFQMKIFDCEYDKRAYRIRHVAGLIYGNHGENEYTTSMVEQNKTTQTYGERRVNSQCLGRRAFTKREARTWHDWFRFACGDDCAAAFSPEEFVRTPIATIMNKIIENNLVFPWNKLNPVEALRMIEINQPEMKNRPFITIEQSKNKKFTQTRSLPPTQFRHVDDLDTYKIGANFRLVVDGLKKNDDFIVIEFSHKPSVSPETNESVQGLVMPFTKRNGANGYVIREDGEDELEFGLLGLLDGGFGFCLISYPNHYDAFELFGLNNGGDLMSESEMQQFTKSLQKKTHHDPNISIHLAEYQLSA